jgi:hypothetical protein
MIPHPICIRERSVRCLLASLDGPPTGNPSAALGGFCGSVRRTPLTRFAIASPTTPLDEKRENKKLRAPAETNLPLHPDNRLARRPRLVNLFVPSACQKHPNIEFLSLPTLPDSDPRKAARTTTTLNYCTTKIIRLVFVI